MRLFHRRILVRASVSTDDALDLSGALDLGELRELHVVVTVDEAGTGETARLSVKHAPVNEEAAYLDFETPAEVDLTSTGTTWVQVSSFTRWVHWFLSGTLSENAVVTLDVMAKG